MTSPLDEAVTNIQLNNYVSYIVITAIGYDYTLTFSKETEYIWNQPWTWMSTLFFLARYFGMCSAILHALCNLIFIVGTWCFWIFICSADLVMILRLWALYGRSKFILGTLLTFYAIEIITFFIYYVLVDHQFPRDPAIGITQVLGYTICEWRKVFVVWDNLQGITQLSLGAWMCLLIVIQHIKELVQMYKVTNRFRLGHYHKLLVWEGLVYFIAVVGFGLNCILVNAGLVPVDTWHAVLTTAVTQTLPFILFPRFVLNLRELYAQDLHGRRPRDIDTAFGLGSLSGHGLSSTIVFADGIQNERE